MTITAPVTFAGHGVSAPGHDDYAGIDVRGRIVAALSGPPEDLGADERAHHGSPAHKAAVAAAHGARGLILLVPDARGELWEHFQGQAQGRPALHWTEPDGSGGDAAPLALSALFGRAATARLLGDIPPDLDHARPHALDLEVRAHVAARVTPGSSPNVVGILPGSDPARAGEAVVISAHLDHLGLAEEGADRVYNGACDNASGVAALLAIARALAARPHAPRRSVVLAAVTGEEQGLLGSAYLARHPVVPRVVADINLDMLPLLYPLQDATAIGAEHSTLGAVAEAAGRELGLPLVPDPIADQKPFVRSDQYSFVQAGVPSLLLLGGFGGPVGTDREEQFRDWLKEVYHSPGDDMGQPLHFESGVAVTRLALLVALRVADADEVPRWREGDFFGTTFGGP